MPGTIHVSVFDFKNISSSSICLWVSMGKKAYQTWDKGDFSFPLTTLRENLVVRLEDAEGNEISRTEIETLSIVEKGYWDDFFQIEGGHYVHMKLQFLLSEDERNRIRNVRESALKKKQDKVPATNVEYKGTVRDTFASSLPIRRVFSDAQSILKMDVTGKKQSVSQQKILSDPSNKPEDQGVQSMLRIDVAAKKESLSQKKIVDPSDKPEAQIAQSMLKTVVAVKKESISQKKNVDSSNKSEDQGLLEKTPSSVRKMISAFETGLTEKKERRSLTRTRASKSQPNLVGIGSSLKDLDPDNTSRPHKMSALRLERLLNTVGLPEPQINIGKRVESSSSEQDILGTEQPVFHEQLKQSSVYVVPFNETGSSQPETFGSAKKESDTVASSTVDLMRLSDLETATSSQTTSVAHPGKNIVHLSEDCRVGVEDHQRNKRPSTQEITVKRGFFHRSDSMTKKQSEKPQKPRDWSENSGENGSSGPVRQVIKVALIVGFGILVLFTRKRETRSNDRKSKGFYLTSPDFMDQLGSSENNGVY